jgi:hypothetical protein
VKWEGHVARRGEERCINGFGGGTEGRRSLERIRHRWDDNMKLDLKDMGCDSIDWITLA